MDPPLTDQPNKEGGGGGGGIEEKKNVVTLNILNSPTYHHQQDYFKDPRKEFLQSVGSTTFDLSDMSDEDAAKILKHVS